MSDKEVLKGQDAFDLYKQGREAWNAWAGENKDWVVDFTGWDFVEEEAVDFGGIHFPMGDGGVSFFEAKFGEDLA